MTAYKQGDVVLTPYPFGARAGGKRRPVLVLSSLEYNQATGELVIAQITSSTSAQAHPGDYHIEAWQEANLPSPALVRGRLATLKSSLVLRRLGELTESDFRAVRQALGDVILS